MSKNKFKFSLPGRGPNHFENPLPEIELPLPGDYEEDIKVIDIAPSPHQTREIDIDSDDIVELASNIEAVGLINPILLRPNKDPNGKYKWILVAGERRLSAYRLLGRDTIPARIRESLKDNDLDAWSITLCENVMRRQLRSDEAGKAIDDARNKLKLTNKEIADRMGVSEIRVSQLHGANKLSEDLRDTLDRMGKLTKRHIDAFKLIIKSIKLDSIRVQENDSPEIKIVKDLVNQLLSEINQKDLSGEEAIKISKELINPNQTKSILSTINKRLTEIIKRRPKRISDKKRKLIISQAQNMIYVLQKLIDEETQALNK